MSIDTTKLTDGTVDGYYERLPVDGVLRVVFISIALGVLAGGIAMFFVFMGADSFRNPFFIVFAAAWSLVGIFAIYVALAYRSLEIEVSGRNLELKLGFLKTVVPLSVITAVHLGRCNSGPHVLPNLWTVLGSRLGIGTEIRSWIVPFRGGVTIHLNLNGGKDSHYVSSKTPDKLKDALERFSGSNETSGGQESA